MPRKNLIRSNKYPYHITNRYNNKNNLEINLRQAWDVYSKYLYAIKCIYGVRIHAFVMMQNHYHLILSTPDKNLDDAMKYFQTQISKAINHLSGEINHRFGSRYHWCLIEKSDYLSNVIRYVYLNPVKAKLCKKAELYPWSSLNRVNGYGSLYFPVAPLNVFHNSIPDYPIALSRFVNQDYPDDVYIFTEKKLKRPVFRLTTPQLAEEQKVVKKFQALLNNDAP